MFHTYRLWEIFETALRAYWVAGLFLCRVVKSAYFVGFQSFFGQKNLTKLSHRLILIEFAHVKKASSGDVKIFICGLISHHLMRLF
eukprot:UN10747